MMISGIAFDRPDRLRMFPYDCFKFYTIIRIELSSIQTIAVLPVIQIISDHSGSVSTLSSRSPEHCLKKLGDPNDHMETRLKTH